MFFSRDCEYFFQRNRFGLDFSCVLVVSFLLSRYLEIFTVLVTLSFVARRM